MQAKGKGKGKGKGKKKKRAAYEGSSDEDESSSDSSLSLGSENDDSASSDSVPDEFQPNDGFGQDLMGDDDDRKYLATLAELDREQILATRSEARETERQKWMVSTQLKKNKKKSASSRGGRKVTASRGSMKQQAALSDLKRAREKGKRKTKYRDDDDEEEDESSEGEMSAGSDEMDANKIKARAGKAHMGAYGGSGAARARRRAAEEEEEEEDPRADEDIEPDEVRGMVVSRNRLAHWAEEPFFDERVVGFYVKVSLGPDDNGVPVYRLGRIAQVGEATSKYPIDIKNAATSKLTRKTITVEVALHKRKFKLCYVSNSPVDVSDVGNWRSALFTANINLPKRRDLTKKLKDRKYCDNYVTTEADINKILEQKKKEGKLKVNLALHKSELLQQRQHFADEVMRTERALALATEKSGADADAVVTLEDELAKQREDLAAVDERLRVVEEKQREQREDILAKEAQITAWQKINNKNRTFNQSAKTIEESGGGVAATNKMDPFSRRPCRPMILFSTKQKQKQSVDGEDGEGKAEKDGGAGLQVDTGAAAEAYDPLKSPPAGTPRNMPTAQQALRDEHNITFDLDVGDLDKGKSEPSKAPLPGMRKAVPAHVVAAAAAAAPTESKGGKLSLRDWQRRRNLVE